MPARIVLVAILAAACSGSIGRGSGGGASSSAAPEELARVEADGLVRVAVDPADRPQSWFDRRTRSWRGFDVDVAEEIATRLGVTAQFQPRNPGSDGPMESWGDRLDMEFSPTPVMNDQSEAFRYTTPYSYWPASIAVSAATMSIQDPTTDLSGKRICVGKGTTYEAYLEKRLSIGDLAPPFDYVIDQPRIVLFPTDLDALNNLAFGGGSRCDAVMTALPTIARYVASGGPVKVVGHPLYYEPFAIAFGKNGSMDSASLIATVSRLVQDMHADGTLAALSEKWFNGQDLTTAIPTGG
jgi:polar amino acid transport system substrate-binding protein